MKRRSLYNGQGYNKADERNWESSHSPSDPWSPYGSLCLLSCRRPQMLEQPLENWKNTYQQIHHQCRFAPEGTPTVLLRLDNSFMEEKCVFSPRAQRGHKTADFPTVTHLQSVSLTGVCSHLISAHTLCLSLAPWGDGTPSARAVHTHAHTRACADTLFGAQRLQSGLLDSAYLSAARGQHDTTLTHSLSTSCNIENHCLDVIAP